MDIWVILTVVISIVAIILIGAQGSKSEDASTAIMGGAQDTKLFAETKERGIDLFLTRATAVTTGLFFVFILLSWYL